MQPNDYQRFNAVMIGMAKLYERELDKPLLDAYWLALRDWPLDAFEQAAGRLMATNKFMPRPADFNELRKAHRPVAAEAWIKARASTSTAYTPRGYVGGTSADPLIDRAVHAIGGYSVIAMCDTDKLHFLERRFTEAYEAMQEAEDVRAALPQLGNSTFGLAALTKQLEERRSKHEPKQIPGTAHARVVDPAKSVREGNRGQTTQARHPLDAGADSQI